MRSGAGWLASAAPEQIDAFLGGLSEASLMALPWIFDFWALPHQLPPEGAWKTWVIMGGRGAGKTRAGAEWVRAQVEGDRPMDAGRARRVALVGETQDQVREVMIFGESGILACSPPDRRPEWNATRRTLTWPNGAVAQVFSAHDPDSLRGPQFDAAWVDELAKWKKGDETWDMLQFALRLGEHPQQVVTTTPQNVAVLKGILRNPSTVMTHAPTEANRAYLATSFLDEVYRRYGGQIRGAVELEGRGGGGRARAQGLGGKGAGRPPAGSGPDRGGGGPAGECQIHLGRMRDRGLWRRNRGRGARLDRYGAGGCLAARLGCGLGAGGG